MKTDEYVSIETAKLMTEEYWKNSQLSIAKYYGTINFNGVEYIICDKLGRDIFECSAIAEKEGRDMAIEPGEPCDLVIRDWLPLYRQVGRERFMEIARLTCNLETARLLAKGKTESKE